MFSMFPNLKHLTTSPPAVSLATISDYYYDNSSYPSKLSTIPEIYQSVNDLQDTAELCDEQIGFDSQSPPLPLSHEYKYTKNESEYIASGDLKNTNLATFTSQEPLIYQSTTIGSSIPATNTQPEQKKSRFGLGENCFRS